MLWTKGKIEKDTLILTQVNMADGHEQPEMVERYPLDEVIDHFPLIQTRGDKSDVVYIYRQDVEPPGFEPVGGLDINELQNKLPDTAIAVESLTYGIPHDKVSEWAKARINGDEKALNMAEEFRHKAREEAAANGQSELVLVNRELIRQVEDRGAYRTILVDVSSGPYQTIHTAQSQLDVLTLWAYGKRYTPDNGRDDKGPDRGQPGPS